MSISIDSNRLRTEIRSILEANSDKLTEVTPKQVRYELEQRLGYDRDGLLEKKSEINQAIRVALDAMPSNVKSEPTAEPAASSNGEPQWMSSSNPSSSSKKRPLPAPTPASDEEEESDEPDEEPAAKRPKQEEKSSPATAASSSGDPNTVLLGASKRVEVRTFKGHVLIDIRETYIDKTSGEERPGKKGIALKPEQWETLLKNASKINAAIARVR